MSFDAKISNLMVPLDEYSEITQQLILAQCFLQANQKLLRCLSLDHSQPHTHTHSQNLINTFGQRFGTFIATRNIVWLQL